MKEESLLECLDVIVRHENVASVIDAAVLKLEEKLAKNPNELFVWENIPLSALPDSVPSEIKSCWVFFIRAGIPPDKHRHPNSIQRTVAWRGSGDLQVAKGRRWISNILVADPGAPLHPRWVSIPANTWHRPVVSSDWVVVSFHEVSADELMEEAGEEKRSRKYVS